MLKCRVMIGVANIPTIFGGIDPMEQPMMENPSSSESVNDPSSDGDLHRYMAFPLQNSESGLSFMQWLSTQIQREARNPKPNRHQPTSSTGIHPSIRTTSTDSEERMSPIPPQVDPSEEVAGESDTSSPNELADDDYEDAVDQI